MKAVQEFSTRLRVNIQRVIVGKDEAVDIAILALLCDGHILLEDMPGVGKTTLAKALARSLSASFKRIQGAPDLLPSDITGVSYFNQKSQEFEFRPGPIFANVLLVDEINRATPRAQAALLEAMQERQATMDGNTMPLPKPFLVIATQNPIELEGTFPLPEAQIDRFFARIKLGYPTEAEEHQLLERFERADPLTQLQPVAEASELLQMQDAIRTVRVERSVSDYLVKLCRKTRGATGAQLGVSPRGTLALYRAAQARAATQGRDFVTPDDVKRLVPYVLLHRIVLDGQARLRNRNADEVLNEALESTPAPVDSV